MIFFALPRRFCRCFEFHCCFIFADAAAVTLPFDAVIFAATLFDFADAAATPPMIRHLCAAGCIFAAFAPLFRRCRAFAAADFRMLFHTPCRFRHAAAFCFLRFFHFILFLFHYFYISIRH